MAFLNIIFCSLPGNWCIEDVLGVDGLCPAVTSRASMIAPACLCHGFGHGPNVTEFFMA
jgi:hypothetical protein